MVETAPSTDLEWSLLKTCCSPSSASLPSSEFGKRVPPGVDWNRLFELAETHGVQPLLYQALSYHSEFVPHESWEFLQQTYARNLHKALFLARELIRIVEALECRSINVLPYKGLALAEILYGDIALRQSRDIDLLILPDALPYIREIVGSLGYIAHTPCSSEHEREFIRSGYELSFDGPAGPNLLEVQWAIQPRFYGVEFGIEEVFHRAMEISVAGRKIKTPCLEDLFIILSLHAAKHVWARLIWICDLARMMTLTEVNWKNVGGQATALGIARLLRVGIDLATRFTGVSIPAELDSNLPADPLAAHLAQQIENEIMAGSLVDVESLQYFRRMIQLRERASDRCQILSRLVLTPGPGEWNAVWLPRSLFPLYRVVRLGRLASKLAR